MIIAIIGLFLFGTLCIFIGIHDRDCLPGLMTFFCYLLAILFLIGKIKGVI